MRTEKPQCWKCLQLAMSCEAIKTPRMIWRKDSSILINWADVYPQQENQVGRTFEVRLQDAFDDWRLVYWYLSRNSIKLCIIHALHVRGKKLQVVVSGLQPATCYTFKIRAIPHSEEWLQFKAATSTDQFYVRDLTRSIRCTKIAQIRKIINARPYLLDAPNADDKTPLMQAAEDNNLHVLTFLCNLGANINVTSLNSHRSALMIALFYGHLNIARFLLAKNANIHLRDINARSALFYAIDSDCLDGVVCALDHGANLHDRDNQGWSPLLRAVVLEIDEDIIKLLLERGSDRSVVDSRGIDFGKHLELTNRLHLLRIA